MNKDSKHSKKVISIVGVFVVLGIIGSIASAHNKNQVNLNATDTGNSTNSPSSSSASITVGSSTTGSSTTAGSTVGSSTSSTPAAAPAATCYSASQAWNEIGQTGCVTFTGYSYTSYKGEMYLDQDSSDYSDGFSVWIPAGESFGPSVLSQYSGVPIDVSGTISQYGGAPQIEVTEASQITAAQ